MQQPGSGSKFTTEKFGGKFPGKVVGCGIVDKKGTPAAELIIVVDINGEPHEAKYQGEMTKEPFAGFCIDSLLTAGFKGKGFLDLKKGVNSDTFDVVEFTVTLEKVTNEKGNSWLQVKYINAPSNSKPFEGSVNDAAGSFAAARQAKGMKANASAPATKTGW